MNYVNLYYKLICSGALYAFGGNDIFQLNSILKRHFEFFWNKYFSFIVL